ncbi:MAG: TetR/AcrR family transcriptional regulator [Firmicutes bacterium]|nr:TetR/AcrR family transcriptional regulator [Bacillota bacterium]
MSNKEIQRQRMTRYFIDAAKTIIRTEGAADVTVRKVAEVAGYSYTTMYNYFADLNELLWYVIADYVDEMVTVMRNTAEEQKKAGLDDVALCKATLTAYVNFYLDNPGAYRFGFFEQIGEPPQAVLEKLQTPVMANLQADQLLACVEKGLLVQEDLAVISDLMTGFVHGLLLFYFSERRQLGEKQLFAKLEQGVDYLLKRKEGKDGDD